MKEELLNTKEEKFGNEIPLLDFIYIIPTRRNHDGGYKQMEIIGKNTDGYIKKLSTYSDVIDLDGIIGKVDNWLLSIDMPEYGVLRFFSHRGKFRVIHYGISTFSFEIVEDKEVK